MNKDLENIRLLSTFHYVVSALMALFACFPFIHLAVGIGLLLGGDSVNWEGGEAPPEFVAWIFIGIATFIIILGWTMAILVFMAARSLKRHKRYKFCFVVACIECLFMPFGTVLGVLTLIVLSRPTVKELFFNNSSAAVEATFNEEY